MPNRCWCGLKAASGVAPLTCAIQGPAAICRATVPIALSGTQSRTRSASPLSASSLRSLSRALTADPTRPRPITEMRLNMTVAVIVVLRLLHLGDRHPRRCPARHRKSSTHVTSMSLPWHGACRNGRNACGRGVRQRRIGVKGAFMRVRDLMTPDVRTVHERDTLDQPAQIMWDHDCGAVPVVDNDGRIVGMVTDRDICMAAHFRGQPLTWIQVGTVMSREICACQADDQVTDAERLMSTRQLHRLPVLN